MEPARIRELLQPFLAGQPLLPEQLTQLSRYLDLLLHWNARINLTAIRDPEEVVTRHFGESLFTARHLPAVPATLADVGSGAGFPGLPIKIWSPDLHITLIESNQKKATFLREVIRALSLADAWVNHHRAEDLPPASFDIVTLRAVERFETALAAAIQLLKPGGTVALLIGGRQAAAAQSMAKTVHWNQMLALPLSSSRMLVLGARTQDG